MSNDYSFNMNEVFFDSTKVHYQGISHKITEIEIKKINNITHYLIETEEEHLFSFAEGLLHSEDNKASVTWNDGTQMWYNKGKIHRPNEEPAIIWSFGKEEYYTNGIKIEEKEIQKFIVKNKIQQF